MTLCYEVEEEADEEDGREENSSGEMDKTVATLETMPKSLNRGQIFSLLNENRQHKVTALKHPKLFADNVNWAIHRENVMLPVYKTHYSKMIQASFSSVATSSKGLLQDKSEPMVCTSDYFNPNAYKLMEESGHGFSKPPSPGHIIGTKPYGTNDAQKMVQKQGEGIVTPRVDLVYMSSQLVKVSR